MAVSKEDLSDYKELYEKASRLIKEESKNDPPNEPYRSHYEARNVLEELRQNLKNQLVSIEADGADDGKVDLVYKVLLASVCCKLGRIYVFTEEVTVGEGLLGETLKILKEHKFKKEAVLPYLRALNEIATIYANRHDHQMAYDKLIEGQELYMAYKKSENGEPLTIDDVLAAGAEIEAGKGFQKLESLYTHCTFYLAQVYGHLGELEKSADYCHYTLKRQLEAKSYDRIDFALNAATLSQYYIGQNLFREARHHLSAATYLMDENEKDMFKPEMTEKERENAIETHRHRYADVARCWAKYGLSLLNTSKEHLYEDDDDEEGKLAKELEKTKLNKPNHRFPDMDLSDYEKRITDEYCLTFDDAKKVYHFTITWLDKAQAYYTPETEATEYAKVIKDYAELYAVMAFFEEDPNNQCKMHKRRAKYYEDLLELLNPVFYMNICRECWYGAALAYNSIIEIKHDILKETGTVPKPSEVQKINQFGNKAIEYISNFIKSYLDKNTKEIKTNLDAEQLRLVLYAYFRLAHLHFKLMTHEPAVQIENYKSSLKYYTLFLDECKKYEEVAKTMQSEIGVSKEIQGLLPLQIANLQKRITDQ